VVRYRQLQPAQVRSNSQEAGGRRRGRSGAPSAQRGAEPRHGFGLVLGIDVASHLQEIEVGQHDTRLASLVPIPHQNVDLDGPPALEPDHKRSTPRVSAAEGVHTCRVEAVRRPLALDDRRRLAAGQEHEVDLAAMLAAPVPSGPPSEMGVHLVEDEVLPEPAEIVGPQRGPALLVAYEPGVEGVDLRG